MLGLAEYAQAFNDPVARQEALDLFHLLMIELTTMSMVVIIKFTARIGRTLLMTIEPSVFPEEASKPAY